MLVKLCNIVLITTLFNSCGSTKDESAENSHRIDELHNQLAAMKIAKYKANNNKPKSKQNTTSTGKYYQNKTADLQGKLDTVIKELANQKQENAKLKNDHNNVKHQIALNQRQNKHRYASKNPIQRQTTDICLVLNIINSQNPKLIESFKLDIYQPSFAYKSQRTKFSSLYKKYNNNLIMTILNKIPLEGEKKIFCN